MLNQTAEYALRVVVALSRLGPEESAQAGALATALGLPANYLSKILHQLAAAGVLESRRGRGGGFRLAAPASRLALADVVAPFDDVAHYRDCALGNRVCSERTACAVHARWKPIAESILTMLRETTVEELAAQPPQARPVRSRVRRRAARGRA
jgi:Rrf2 family transcriptional regulator, iron-sulfur cluster assembly transcription factor